MDVARVGGCAVIGVTGVALSVPTGTRVASAGGSAVGLALAIFGLLVGVALLAAALLVYRSDVDTGHALRIAGWNTLGVIALGAVLALVALSRTADLPLFVAATIVGVSAVAHVLIGVNDVRRIRAETLARERRKLSVLNRLVRHDLRSHAQILLGLADRVTDASVTEREDAAESIRDIAGDLGDMNDRIKGIQGLIEAESLPTGSVPVAEVARTVVDDVGAVHPDATVTLDVPEGLAVEADATLRDALYELVENAVVHADRPDPDVRVSAAAVGDRVEIRVADDGPGIPEGERAVVAGEHEITPLEHGSGLGLWVAKWIAGAHGGSLGFEDDGEGTTIVLSLHRAGGA